MKKISFSPSFYLLLAVVCGLVGVQVVQAVTTTIISSSIQMERHRVSYTEVKNAPTVSDPDGDCGGLAKRVVVDTIQPGGQLVSIVSHANTAFASTSTGEIHVQAIRAEQGGVQISEDDIGTPNSSMTDPSYIENRSPMISNYNFYDESSSWDIVAYFCGFDATSSAPVSLNGLTAGSADFYELVTK
ncbi:MAG TPA: hypothetical protein VMU11_02650 [Verrucomicrobiae bacterium]|nr:hypothetical protein [Verrucomicrobiae bacterium]